MDWLDHKNKTVTLRGSIHCFIFNEEPTAVLRPEMGSTAKTKLRTTDVKNILT